MKINGWFTSNIRTIITVLVLIIGFTVTATTVSSQVSNNSADIESNKDCIDMLREDISELKGDTKEVKAILTRIERIVDN